MQAQYARAVYTTYKGVFYMKFGDQFNAFKLAPICISIWSKCK